MAKQVVFLLHGMGSHADGWSKEGVAELQRNAGVFGYPLDFDTELEFIEINYNHKFEEYIEASGRNAESLTGLLSAQQVGATSSVFKGFFDFGMSALDNTDFVVSHLGDVFLYRLAEYSEVVRLFVIEQMIAALTERDHPQWSVVAHSLGTRVVHDALDDMAADPNVFAVFGKPLGVAMIANVALLLAYSPSRLWRHTAAYPSAAMGDGACFRYVNALHPADPFTWIRRFEPPPVWGGNAIAGEFYKQPDIQIGDLTSGNPHSFKGYLNNPIVSADVCWALGTGNTLLPPSDPALLDQASSDYRQNTAVGAAATTLQRAEELIDQRNLGSFVEFTRALRDFEGDLQNLGASLFG